MVLEPFLVEKYIPEEGVLVAWVFCRLLWNRAGGASGMRGDNLQSWLQAETREESTEPAHWGKVDRMIQGALCEGHLAEKCTRYIVVLIP